MKNLKKKSTFRNPRHLASKINRNHNQILSMKSPNIATKVNVTYETSFHTYLHKGKGDP